MAIDRDALAEKVFLLLLEQGAMPTYVYGALLARVAVEALQAVMAMPRDEFLKNADQELAKRGVTTDDA